MKKTTKPDEAPSRVFTCRVPTEHLEELKRVEKKTGATVGEQVRRGILLWLQKQGEVK